MPPPPNSAAGLTIRVHLVEAKDLMIADINWRGTRSSDPFVRLYLNGVKRGYSQTVFKSEDPVWDENIVITVGAEEVDEILEQQPPLQLQIWDKDRLSGNDPMGTVEIPLTIPETQPRWYDVGKGEGKTFAEDASGKMLVGLQVQVHPYRNWEVGCTYALRGPGTTTTSHTSLAAQLSWSTTDTDVDFAAVAIQRDGSIQIEDCVYGFQPRNANSSLKHTGEHHKGLETISCQLPQLPPRILAIYLVVCVAQPDQRLTHAGDLVLRMTDTKSGIGLYRFTTSPEEEETAATSSSLVMLRWLRDPATEDVWYVTPLLQTDTHAHDFGALLPRLQAMTKDVLPDLSVDPYGRLAVRRKAGSTVRILDYVRTMPTQVIFGLRWMAGELKEEGDELPVNLNALALCLDDSYGLVETVSCDNLTSSNGGAVRHSGDQCVAGGGGASEENITVMLDNVPETVHAVVFVVHSQSGEKLHRVEQAACRLTAQGGKDLAVYPMDGARDLFGKTALLVCALCRHPTEGWNLRILSHACRGTTVQENVDEAQAFFENHPPSLPFCLPGITEEDLVEMSVLPEFSPLEGENGEEILLSMEEFMSQD